jgi:hypothetical protein
VFEALGEDAKSERLHVGDRGVSADTVTEDAGQGGHLGDPAPVILALEFDRKDHRRMLERFPRQTRLSFGTERSQPDGPIFWV